MRIVNMYLGIKTWVLVTTVLFSVPCLEPPITKETCSKSQRFSAELFCTRLSDDPRFEPCREASFILFEKNVGLNWGHWWPVGRKGHKNHEGEKIERRNPVQMYFVICGILVPEGNLQEQVRAKRISRNRGRCRACEMRNGVVVSRYIDGNFFVR